MSAEEGSEGSYEDADYISTKDVRYFSSSKYDASTAGIPTHGAKYSVVILGTKRVKESKEKSSFTAYKLRVTDEEGNVWISLRRYSELRSLMEKLKENYDRSKVPHKFPGKKIVGNMDPQSIDQRHMQLQTWMNKVLAHSELGRSKEIVQFLEEYKLDPANFIDSAEEENNLFVRLDLGKMGYLYKLHSGQWKRGWFVLRNDVLYKYRSHSDRRAYGQYVWKDCTVTEVELPGSQLQDQLYCFMVTTPKNKKFVFATESEEECEEWILAINQAIQLGTLT